MTGLQIQIVLSVLILVVFVRVAVIKVGALWLRLPVLGLLVTLLIWRADAIGMYYGIDLVGPAASNFITLLIIITIELLFEAARIRKPYLERAERQRHADLLDKHNQHIQRLEAIRREDELRSGQSWDNIVTFKVQAKR
jgi:uncharacterized membrane protein YhiD involved in acid resistance